MMEFTLVRIETDEQYQEALEFIDAHIHDEEGDESYSLFQHVINLVETYEEQNYGGFFG
jgi:hypothetical protein